MENKSRREFLRTAFALTGGLAGLVNDSYAQSDPNLPMETFIGAIKDAERAGLSFVSKKEVEINGREMNEYTLTFKIVGGNDREINCTYDESENNKGDLAVVIEDIPKKETRLAIIDKGADGIVDNATRTTRVNNATRTTRGNKIAYYMNGSHKNDLTQAEVDANYSDIVYFVIETLPKLIKDKYKDGDKNGK